jgi:hypothetical protein
MEETLFPKSFSYQTREQKKHFGDKKKSTAVRVTQEYSFVKRYAFISIAALHCLNHVSKKSKPLQRENILGLSLKIVNSYYFGIIFIYFTFFCRLVAWRTFLIQVFFLF